ncbi:MAG: hypothetical protein JO293_04495 [Candidatus Eremiobacteraeota bacterium]|nr:hypothetical protein [Candidatus Eremiobacteraeota bacterium]MBV8282237.1 hypothetical protein [Candidatus Eremiobacteraeota bacterium]
MEKRNVLVGRSVTVRANGSEREYFTDAHRRWVGHTGRIHAVVAGDRDNPLIKVGFEDGTRIVFYRLADLDVDEDAALSEPKKHGQRGSHLPKLG